MRIGCGVSFGSTHRISSSAVKPRNCGVATETGTRQSSPEFSKLWKKHEVSRAGVGRKEIRHPREGLMVFEHAVFNPAEAPDQRLVLYSPLPEEDTPAKLARLLEGVPTAGAVA